jgi:hypothetical protein
MLLGVWVIVFLFLGFPPFWDKIFALITGLAIIAVTIQLRPEQPIVKSEETQTSTIPPVNTI